MKPIKRDAQGLAHTEYCHETRDGGLDLIVGEGRYQLSPERIADGSALGQTLLDLRLKRWFTPEALALIVRSGEGLLRRTRNLCLSSLIEAVRDQTRIVDLKQVNRVLIQPHWRKDCDNPL